MIGALLFLLAMIAVFFMIPAGLAAIVIIVGNEESK